MFNLSALRNRVGSLTLGLAILVLVGLVCLVASILFATRFVEDTVALAVVNLSQRSGLSIFLVKAVVIAGTIPFFWAVGKFTKNIWGLLNLGWDSMALYKNKYGVIIVGYVSLYFFAMYAASVGAYEYKYCAETPEGIWTSDSPGKDPVYGIEAIACSQTQRLALRAGTGHLRPPHEILITDAENYEWFDPATGQPRVWYSVAADHGFRYFDGRGVDPRNRQELKPISADIVERVRRQQASQAAAQQQGEKEATLAKLREDAEAQQESEIATLTQQAQSAFESKDYNSVIETCSQVLKISDKNSPCLALRQHSSIKLSEELVSKGQAHLERGEFDEAIWNAEKAIDLDPANRTAVKLEKLAAQLKVHALQ